LGHWRWCLMERKGQQGWVQSSRQEDTIERLRHGVQFFGQSRYIIWECEAHRQGGETDYNTKYSVFVGQSRYIIWDCKAHRRGGKAGVREESAVK